MHVSSSFMPMIDKALKTSGATGVREIKRNSLMRVLLLPSFGNGSSHLRRTPASSSGSHPPTDHHAIHPRHHCPLLHARGRRHPAPFDPLGLRQCGSGSAAARELASGGTMRLSRAHVVAAWPGCPSSAVRGVPVWLSPQTYGAFCHLGGTWIHAAWADRPRRACVLLAGRAC